MIPTQAARACLVHREAAHSKHQCKFFGLAAFDSRFSALPDIA